MSALRAESDALGKRRVPVANASSECRGDLWAPLGHEPIALARIARSARWHDVLWAVRWRMFRALQRYGVLDLERPGCATVSAGLTEEVDSRVPIRGCELCGCAELPRAPRRVHALKVPRIGCALGPALGVDAVSIRCKKRTPALARRLWIASTLFCLLRPYGRAIPDVSGAVLLKDRLALRLIASTRSLDDLLSIREVVVTVAVRIRLAVCTRFRDALLSVRLAEAPTALPLRGSLGLCRHGCIL